MLFRSRLGATVTRLPVDSTGMVDPDAVRRALSRKTTLVSVMHANNEVGTVEPIAEIARITREHGVPLHVDAAQSVGKIDADVQRLGADLAANDHRQDYLRSTLSQSSGALTATPFSKQDSSMLSLLSKSDGLIVRPPKDPAKKAGESVRVLPFASAIPAI